MTVHWVHNVLRSAMIDMFRTKGIFTS